MIAIELSMAKSNGLCKTQNCGTKAQSQKAVNDFLPSPRLHIYYNKLDILFLHASALFGILTKFNHRLAAQQPDC